VENIAHVVNYDLPELAENFIHRVGRTGRAGAQGVATTLFSRDQRTELFQLERTLGLRIERLPVDLSSLAKQEKDHEERASRIASTFKRQVVRLPGEFLQAQMG
jgi:ATP-dependent RNA helicase RhlE